MSENGRQGVMQCGRKISAEEVEQIRETVELLPGLAMNELAATICEHLEWYTAGGGLKVDACLKLLNKLEAEGVLELTERQRARRYKNYTRNDEIVISGRTDPESVVKATVRELEEVRLEVVVEPKRRSCGTSMCSATTRWVTRIPSAIGCGTSSVALRADSGACCSAERRRHWEPATTG